MFDWMRRPERVAASWSRRMSTSRHFRAAPAGCKAAYADAALVLADGMPIVWASRMLRPAVALDAVTGSDLVPAVFEAGQPQGELRVFCSARLPEWPAAATNIVDRWPRVRVVDVYSPRLGFERDAARERRNLAGGSPGRPDLLVVGLGAQARIVGACSSPADRRPGRAVRRRDDRFLAGERSGRRRGCETTGLEWIHRLAGEPSASPVATWRDAWIFPRLVLRIGRPG